MLREWLLLQSNYAHFRSHCAPKDKGLLRIPFPRTAREPFVVDFSTKPVLRGTVTPPHVNKEDEFLSIQGKNLVWSNALGIVGYRCAMGFGGSDCDLGGLVTVGGREGEGRGQMIDLYGIENEGGKMKKGEEGFLEMLSTYVMLMISLFSQPYSYIHLLLATTLFPVSLRQSAPKKKIETKNTKTFFFQRSSKHLTTALSLTPFSSTPSRPSASRTSPFSNATSCCCSFHHARCRSHRRF